MSQITDAIGAAAAGANPITALVSLGKDLIDRFIPDPAEKAAALAHLQDQQLTMALAQIDQQTKLTQQAGANIQNDGLSGLRKGFGYAVVSGFVWDTVICSIPQFHLKPVDIPPMFLTAFIALILGMEGTPFLRNVLDSAKTVALAPGDSSVSVLGVKVANKS